MCLHVRVYVCIYIDIYIYIHVHRYVWCTPWTTHAPSYIHLGPCFTWVAGSGGYLGRILEHGKGWRVMCVGGVFLTVAVPLSHSVSLCFCFSSCPHKSVLRRTWPSGVCPSTQVCGGSLAVPGFLATAYGISESFRNDSFLCRREQRVMAGCIDVRPFEASYW